MTSPATRCRQTVEPLAHALGLQAEVREELSEERQWADGPPLVAGLAGTGAVVCGHGGLEAAVLGAGAPRWKKGATLVLDDALRFVERLKPPPDRSR